MKSQQIECFLEVASNHSFSRTAEKLFLSVSMVSYHLSTLEKELGFPLLQRDKHSVKLTPAGEEFYKDMLQVNQLIEKSIQNSRNVHAQHINALHVGWFTFLSLPLSKLVKALKQVDPALKIIPHPFPYFASDIMDNNLDIALIEKSEADDYPEIDFFPIYHSFGSILVNRANPLSKRSFFMVSDLANEVVVFPDNAERVKCLSKIHHDVLLQCPNINIRYIPDFFSTGVSLVRDNLCVMVSPDIPPNLDPNIVSILLQPAHQIETGVAWKVADHSEKTKVCIDTIKKVYC